MRSRSTSGTVKRAVIAGLTLSAAMPANAGEFEWRTGPATASELARLFQSACLDTMPDFGGADAVLDRLGFRSFPTVLRRPHPDKKVAAMVMSAPSAASCVLVVEDIPEPALETELAPRIEAHFPDAMRTRMPGVDLAHAVWSNEAAGTAVKVMISETHGGSVAAISTTNE